MLSEKNNYLESYETISHLYASINNSTEKFMQLMQDKPSEICFVGNSPCELGEENGQAIDAFEYVIRFNKYDVSYPYIKDYGKKCNIWVRTPKNTMGLSPEVLDRYSFVLISGSNWLSRMSDGVETFNQLVSTYNDVCVIPFNVYSKLVRVLGALPSAGLQILYWFYTVNGPVPKNQVYGFSLSDQLQGKNLSYYSSTKENVRHDWQKERSVFDQIIQH